MSQSRIISDEEFVSFLKNLGVDTYNKSFEWMLNHPDFADSLRWIYESLDENNALTAREEYRYADLKKHGRLPDDVENKLALIIQDEFVGLCLPGDQDALEDVKLDILLQKQKLAMLEKQEEVLKGLIEQNEDIKANLTIEVTKLTASQQQAAEDEIAAGEECIKLAKEVETNMNEVVEVIADALNVYGSCAVDKELAKRFFTYGSFESYGQSQELFKSRFDLYTTKKFDMKLNSSNETVLGMALFEARKMEERLEKALFAYIESKADLCGERAKLHLISSGSDILSNITTTIEAQNNANQLLEQEESILGQQIDNAIKIFVQGRTNIVVDAATRSALTVREQICKDLTFIQEVTQQAVALDQLLYYALRRELGLAGELLNFAAHLREYLQEEAEVVSERIKSMNDTCNEIELAERNLQYSDILLHNILAIFGAKPSSDTSLPIKLFREKKCHIQELKTNIQDGHNAKEASLIDIKSQAKPLQDYIWDGCTKKPNNYNRSVSNLTYSFTHELDKIDAKVLKIGENFNTIKNGDKHKMRKIWQWFLTDPGKLPH